MLVFGAIVASGCADPAPCQDCAPDLGATVDMALARDMADALDMATGADLPDAEDMGAPAPCEDDARRCGDTCARCPSEGVLASGCQGEQCVALACDTAAGYSPCAEGCCIPTTPPPSATLPAGLSVEALELALTSRGHPTLLVRDARALTLTWWDGQRWASAPGPQTSSTSRAPRLALDREDRLHLFTIERSPGGLTHHQRAEDGAWSRASILDTATTPDAELIEAITTTAGAETIEVVALLRRFASETSPGQLSVWLARWREGRWEAPQRMSLGDRSCASVAAAVDGNAITHLLVECATPEATATLHHLIAPTQGAMTLATSAPLESGGGGVALGVTPGNEVVALYRSTTGHLSSSTATPTGWGAPTRVDERPSVAAPTLQITRQGARLALHLATDADATPAWQLLGRPADAAAWTTLGAWEGSLCVMRADREGAAHLVTLAKDQLTYVRIAAP